MVITSYEIDGTQEEPPVDQVGLAFAKIETAYSPVDATGKVLSPVKAVWDTKKNAKG